MIACTESNIVIATMSDCIVVKKRLSSLLPDLKAANDSLPLDVSSLDIENLENDEQYIEMDLGLGVLEELTAERDNSANSENEEQASEFDVMAKLLKKPAASKPVILEVSDPKNTPTSALSWDQKIHWYRDRGDPETQPALDIILSLMTRILNLLHAHQNSTHLTTITRLNVLREDLYKLMSRRDQLLGKTADEAAPAHETLYVDELDLLLANYHDPKHEG